MGNAAAITGQLINTNYDIAYLTQQQIFWSGKYEANAAKLTTQTNLYEKWCSAYDSAIDNTKELTAGGVTVRENNKNECLADQYAHAKVSKYDEELSMELAELDIEYDAMQTMYEAMLEKAKADKEAEKSAAQQACQDTCLLQS